MFKIFLTAVILVGCISSSSFSADEFALLHEERLGSLHLDLSEHELKKATACPLQRGPEELWAADEAYHQEWQSDQCGLTLGMVSEQKGGQKVIESITLVSPSTLATRQGCHIGSSEQEVMKAYKSQWNREESEHFGLFVAGSIYGGLMFSFENGQVSRIFLGAAAE